MKEWHSFTERLHFVDYEGRAFAVMAYSTEDARAQIQSALALRWYIETIKNPMGTFLEASEFTHA